jgi:hypothetical protein
MSNPNTKATSPLIAMRTRIKRPSRNKKHFLYIPGRVPKSFNAASHPKKKMSGGSSTELFRRWTRKSLVVKYTT